MSGLSPRAVAVGGGMAAGRPLARFRRRPDRHGHDRRACERTADAFSPGPPRPDPMEHPR